MSEDESKTTGSHGETFQKAGVSGKGSAKCKECGARSWETQTLDSGIVIVYCSWCDVALGCVTM